MYKLLVVEDEEAIRKAFYNNDSGCYVYREAMEKEAAQNKWLENYPTDSNAILDETMAGNIACVQELISAMFNNFQRNSLSPRMVMDYAYNLCFKLYSNMANNTADSNSCVSEHDYKREIYEMVSIEGLAILDFPYFKNINDRVSGFKDGLNAECPGAEIVAVVDAQAKMETALTTTESILETYPNVRCVFGINDDSAKGANEAFHNLGFDVSEVCVIGFDADRGCRKLIAGDEYIKASVAADTDIIGAVCIDTAIKKIEKALLPDWVEVQGAQYLVSKENIAELQK